jgi:hypothetical protein
VDAVGSITTERSGDNVCVDRREAMEFEREVRGVSDAEEIKYVQGKYWEEL